MIIQQEHFKQNNFFCKNKHALKLCKNVYSNLVLILKLKNKINMHYNSITKYKTDYKLYLSI